MSFFVKASIEALKAFPAVNARIEGNEIVYQNYYDIGVAVSTEKGLMVPVIRDADRLSFAAIEKAIAGFAAKAREGTIAVDDLRGGTFTITNGGIFGSMLSTPILNPPQSGILGMHAIKKRPVVVDDQIVVRPMMYLALSYDHRIIDGREAVSFLVRIKDGLENPERLDARDLISVDDHRRPGPRPRVACGLRATHRGDLRRMIAGGEIRGLGRLGGSHLRRRRCPPIAGATSFARDSIFLVPLPDRRG